MCSALLNYTTSGLFSAHLAMHTLGCLYLLMNFVIADLFIAENFDVFGIRFSRNDRLFSQTVEIKGFEPLTPCLQGRCSPN